MPKLDLKLKTKEEEYEVHAKGFFIMALSFSNNEKPRIKRWIKEYETKEKEK